MNTATLPADTHQAIKDLMAAGNSEQEAEAIVNTVRNLTAGTLATKTDIATLIHENAVTHVPSNIAFVTLYCRLAYILIGTIHTAHVFWVKLLG